MAPYETTRASVNRQPNGTLQADQEVTKLDALIVGAGFGGVYQLKRLRDEGFNVKLVEAGTEYGGVWHWNKYPGARVDIPIPDYQFSDPALWTSYPWPQRFPDSTALRSYFSHVAKIWNLDDDDNNSTLFSQFVDSALWDEETLRWNVSTRQGLRFEAKYLLLNTGFAAKRHFPDWKGIDVFEGQWIHPSYWPADDDDNEHQVAVKDKRVAIIGTGSTGVQLIQELGKVAGELVVFQRTPNLAIPMKQEEFEPLYDDDDDDDEQRSLKGQRGPNANHSQHVLQDRNNHFGGLIMDFLPRATFQDDAEERERVYEGLWRKGDFSFWLGNYYDMLFSPDANTAAYNFWRDKTRARIHDERLKDKLAPQRAPHHFGCKRVSLEQTYFETFNLPNVHLVDIIETPVLEVTPTGITTTAQTWTFDTVICATGFDAVTGGLLQMGIRGRDGLSLKEKWEGQRGVRTWLGMASEGFPNMFFTYGPQAPTPFCSGPTCAEMQGEWIVEALKHMRDERLSIIEATEESEEVWAEETRKMMFASLMPTAKSWYMGDNIPGKRREPLVYLGGVPQYYKELRDCAAAGYKGFCLR